MDHQERPRDKISAHREFKVVKITHFSSFKSRILSFFAVCEEKNHEELRILLQVFRAEVFDVTFRMTSQEDLAPEVDQC